MIISHGTILERAIDSVNNLQNNLKEKISIIDLLQCKPFPSKLKNIVNQYKNILTIDEQTTQSSLGSIIFENSKNSNNIISMSLPDKFIFENVGRSKLLDINGLSIRNISNKIKLILK